MESQNEDPTEIGQRPVFTDVDGLGEAKTLRGDTPGPDGPVDPDLLELTSALPRYRLGESLGEGGMGEVRLCLDRRVGREVAMKVVRREHTTRTEIKSRFLKEARVQGQLEHPSIVPVYDIGVGSDGVTYFTMKRVRGRTVADLIEGMRTGDGIASERDPRRRLLTAFGTVCMAVEYAHARGVTHRDLKPENIMLGDFGEVYVLDWGVARLNDGTEPAEVASTEESGVRSDPGKRTLDGVMVGTPGYMAPEQLKGVWSEVDRRADVYSLGAILFEILALEPLHPNHSAHAAMGSTLQGANAKVSERAPGRTVAPELDAVCVKATAMDPDDRYPTAAALHDAVERYLDGDRDVERRRAMAEDHAELADRKAAHALEGGADALEARKDAMRAVGQSLALDPENAKALHTMLNLLLSPPTEVPAEVTEAMAEDHIEQRRIAMKSGARAYMVWLAFLPLVVWMGVRDWTPIVLSVVLSLAGVVFGYFTALRGRPTVGSEVVVKVISTMAVVTLSRMFGPFVLMPAIMAANTLAFMFSPDRRWRSVFVGVGVLGIVVPAVAERLGLLSPSYRFHDGVMEIVPHMVSLNPESTWWMLLLASVATVATSGMMMGRMGVAALEASQRLHVQSWHLRQIVPAKAHPISVPPPRPSHLCEAIHPLSLDSLRDKMRHA